MKNTVLVVDDVVLNIDVLTDILADSYEIMAAAGGESAIKILGRKKPDLVLLDLSMPKVNGFDVLRFMKDREELANIPVIFVTGEYDADSEETGIRLGAVDYIKKPYNAAIIKAKVRNHLELKTYRDNLERLVDERTRQLQARSKELAASREAIILSMSLISESRDMVTGAHIERIKGLTKILADKMLILYPSIITPEMAEQTILFSPLHDVGKVSIPDNILNKNGSLTREEFDIMKTHTLKAAEMLKKTDFHYSANETSYLDVAIKIAESHHEKYDGTGYPYGLKADEIPLSARIVTLADIYDALRSDRPYKKAYTHEEALQIILEGDGRTMPGHFDPNVLNAFSLTNKEFASMY